MNFTDLQLQKCYDEKFADAYELPPALRPISALIGVHEVFQMFEGSHSARVHETMEQLLAPDLRPGLRCWYQRPDADTSPGALALREQLSQQAGERLETTADFLTVPVR